MHPERVTEYACDVQLIEVSLVGEAHGKDYWEANGRAKRFGMEEWRFSAGEFRAPPPGHPKAEMAVRHKAEMACSRFMDRMTKQIQKLKK